MGDLADEVSELTDLSNLAEQQHQKSLHEIMEPDISTWYHSQRPIYLDLVGDYAGKELFLVDGDSLLRQCFEDDRIDFNDGFQLLHAAFVAERFLDDLIKRQCNFHVAFFDSNRELCIPPGAGKHRSRYLLAREVMIHHLQQHLPQIVPDVQIHVFPSLFSGEFDSFLESSPVHFIMVHDGAISNTGKIEGDTDSDRNAKVLLRGMIWWFNAHKLNVSLINHVDFKDSKIFSMILEGSGLRIRNLEKGMKELWKMEEEKQKPSDVDINIQEGLSKPAVQSFLNSSTTPYSDNLLLIIFSMSAILKQSLKDNFLVVAFMLHAVVLPFLSLSQRRLSLVIFDEDFDTEVNDFLDVFSDIAKRIVSDLHWVQRTTDKNCLVDLVDGRLFRATIQAILERSLDELIPDGLNDIWAMACELVDSLSARKLSPEARDDVAVQDTDEGSDANAVDVGKVQVMPFSEPVFNKHLACIHVTAETALPSRSAAMKLYRETSHWHNHRKPLVVKHIPAEKVSKWRNPQRTNQFYMAEMTTYAASLTGGRALEPETITVGIKKRVESSDKKAPRLGKLPPEVEEADGGKKGGKKAGGLSKKAQFIAANMERKGDLEANKAFSAWTGVMEVYNQIPDEMQRYLQAKSYLDDLDSARSVHVEGDISIYLCQCLLTLWTNYCKAGKKSEGYHVVALLWNVLRSMCVSKAPMSKEISQHVDMLSSLVGISNAVSPISPATERKLSFNFKYPGNPKSLKIDIPQTEFQLIHCGPYMDRNLDAKVDSRVSGFVPDGWQRKVLDELDADNSVFVVAPTSAGKTFISFYAMEKVLRADNDGILVYVAPTKALVNQIAAEIQGRFSKKFPQAGKSVWAIHTRDYRVNNPTGCQILVTVPHILQTMLLAPTNSKSWAPRVRRIIFDEIHCIGAAEDGVVWEQLLLLAPCPIIALSATVGNPEQFSEWLAETQKSLGSKLTMIQHSTRYSDLRKYLYSPPKTFEFMGLGKSQRVVLGLDGLPGLTYFHPVASLIHQSRGMPDDLALEPRDCFLLWKTMCKFQTENYKVPASLDPSKAIPPRIKKIDIFKWEKDLKKLLLEWMNNRNSPFEKVVEELSPKVPSPDQAAIEQTEDNSTKKDVVDQNDLLNTTLPLLYQLHQRSALPAILFNYDRSSCEDIAEALLTQLRTAEDKWKEGKEWKRKIDEWTKWKELKEKKAAKKPAKVSRKKGDDDDDMGSKDDMARDDATEINSLDFFDPQEPLDDFSFADKRRCQKSELDGYIRQLRRKHIKEELISLLQRGIGVHHSGMNRKYRQCVEMLFRNGYLRVVVATGTLSMGINMPCATVVFSGDSVFLTALNFRQAAGRSGRRGFDLLGNVVFQGIDQERVCRLLSSRLPDLTGHFPITTTLVLRLFILLHDSKDSPFAIRSINSLLSQPRLYLGGKSFKEQVLHHLRFSIEYLRRQALLGPNGEPVNFAGCVSHLYFTENSSFAFHALLRGGYFSKLCTDIDTKTDKVLRTMMLVLSHLFGRRLCRQTDSEAMAERIRRSPSMVYLPPMPEDAAKILRTHNSTTLSIFSTYVKTFAEQHVKNDETELPLTKLAVGRQDQSQPEINGLNGTANKVVPPITFLPSLPRPHTRSSFVALSGHGDTFTTITDLCTSSRTGIFLESAVIPHISLHPSETRGAALNAYLLDFFLHGNLQPLAHANGIRRADVWFLLNDFSLVLATIATSLALYLGLGPKGRDAEEEMLGVVGGGDADDNERDEQEAAETIVPATTTTQSTNLPPLLKKGKKGVVVAEDWDAADEDDLEAPETQDMEAEQSRTDDEEYDELMTVYRAFRKLKTEFDTKFLAIWA